MFTPLLLLEINEIPWRLIDRYIDQPELTNLRRFLSRAEQLTSLAVDIGELSPWVTWPTLHRGMNNEAHGVKNLGQDPSTFRGTPIWNEVRRQGGSIGICGSMQSWPPVDPGPGGFYVPDTFAHDERCIPDRVSALQAFNLSQVRRSARVVDSSMPDWRERLDILRAMVRGGVRSSTCLRLAGQVISERFQPSRALRRPIYQAILFWDVFKSLFNPARPPAFSTYFTNHVAGVMHRYWSDVFPEDFPGGAHEAQTHEPLMRFALSALDEIVGDVLSWMNRNPDLVVVFASSMGQGPIHRESHEGVELVVEDLSLLMAHAGAERRDYRSFLAMVPQVALEIFDPVVRKNVCNALSTATCGEDVRFVSVHETGSTVSITVGTPSGIRAMGNSIRLNGKTLTWRNAGIRVQEVEAGTGYHVPEGTLAVYCPKDADKRRWSKRPRVSADRIKDCLLELMRGGTVTSFESRLESR